jgi:hypothetical protein
MSFQPTRDRLFEKVYMFFQFHYKNNQHQIKLKLLIKLIKCISHYTSLFSSKPSENFQIANLGTMVYRQGLQYRGLDKSLAQPTSRCILFDGENISFDASLVLYI